MKKIKTDDYLFGFPIKVDCGCYLVQKKASRNRFVNWIYKRIYGYDQKYYIADGSVIRMGTVLLMNPNTYKSLKGVLDAKEDR